MRQCVGEPGDELIVPARRSARRGRRRSRPSNGGCTTPAMRPPRRDGHRRGVVDAVLVGRRAVGGGAFMNTSDRDRANASSVGMSAVAASVSRWKWCAYSPIRSGVSRSGSTDTNRTRGRTPSGSVSHSACARASSASVVGQTSGQWVKPRNTSVQWPLSSPGTSCVPSDCCSANAGSTRGCGNRRTACSSGPAAGSARPEPKLRCDQPRRRPVHGEDEESGAIEHGNRRGNRGRIKPARGTAPRPRPRACGSFAYTAKPRRKRRDHAP